MKYSTVSKWRPNKFYLASFRDFGQNLKKKKKTNKQTNKKHFPKEFFNEFWFIGIQHEYIYIAEIKKKMGM